MSKSWRPNNEGEGRGLIRCKEPVVVSAISGSRTQTIEAVLMLEAVGLLNGEKGRCLPLTAPKHWLYVTCCAHHSPRPPPTWEAQCARFPICRFLLACGAAPCVISRSKAAHVFPSPRLRATAVRASRVGAKSPWKTLNNLPWTFMNANLQHNELTGRGFLFFLLLFFGIKRNTYLARVLPHFVS